MRSFKIWLIVAVIAFLCVGISRGCISCEKHRAETSERESRAEEQQAKAHEGAAQVYDQQLSTLRQRLIEAEAATSKAKAELDRLKATASKPGAVATTVPPVEELKPLPLDTAKDAYIQALEQKNVILQAALEQAIARGDEYQKAMEAERKARLAQEIAVEAWKSGLRESRNLGRAEGIGFSGLLYAAFGRRR